MIVLSNKPGQLGSLLFIYANLFAYAKENNVRLRNPSFFAYFSYFESTCKRSKILNVVFYYFSFFVSKTLTKLKIKFPFIYVKSLSENEVLDLDKPDKNLNDKVLCFIQGWLYRGNILFEKYNEEIKKYFLPKSEFVTLIDDFFLNSFDSKNEIIIAIHIRRGDYKRFEEGKYLYEISDYVEIAERISQLDFDKNVHFLICSNETIDLSELNLTNLKMTLAPNHELIDLYCMARCHYIVGPPSTYTMWASYYGNVPLYQIQEKNNKITLDDFKINKF